MSGEEFGKCWQCVFYQASGPPARMSSGMGKCHKGPPPWQSVDENDWCGEHQYRIGETKCLQCRQKFGEDEEMIQVPRGYICKNCEKTYRIRDRVRK